MSYLAAWDTHPNEETSRTVAAALLQVPIPGIMTVQANRDAAALEPPARFTEGGEELTSAFRAPELVWSATPPLSVPVMSTYESMRAHTLLHLYRLVDGVVDIHNNATMTTTYGSCGPRSWPIVLQMAAALSLRHIVLLDSRDPCWGGYEYFDVNPNLLVVEGRADNPDYSASWWHDRLRTLASDQAAHQTGVRFYRRLRDITWAKAHAGGFAHEHWTPNFTTPLPSRIAKEIHPAGGRVFALSWPGNGRVGYAPPGLDYFGEAVVELPGQERHA